MSEDKNKIDDRAAGREAVIAHIPPPETAPWRCNSGRTTM